MTEQLHDLLHESLRERAEGVDTSPAAVARVAPSYRPHGRAGSVGGRGAGRRGDRDRGGRALVDQRVPAGG